jgi:hypothetical protein
VNMNEKTQPVVLGPGEGVHLAQSKAGSGVTFKVGAAETGGTLSIFESLRPAGDLGVLQSIATISTRRFTFSRASTSSRSKNG